MIVTEMPVERLVPYARNPRNNTAAINAVKASIAEFGFRQPIVVDEKMVVIVGHTRLEAAKQLGLRMAREGFCDRQYDDDGNLTSRKIPGSVIKDPAVATEHVVRMVTEGEIISRNGKKISCKVDTLCVHGDEPTAIALAAQVRKGLEAAGVEIVPLTQMKLEG